MTEGDVPCFSSSAGAQKKKYSFSKKHYLQFEKEYLEFKL